MLAKTAQKKAFPQSHATGKLMYVSLRAAIKSWAVRETIA